MSDWKKDAIDIFLTGGAAVFGSSARVFADNLGKRKSKAALFALIAGNAVVAGFCGLMVFNFGKIMRFDPYWTQFLAGMSGWMGPAFLSLLEKQVTNKLGGATDAGSSDNS